MPTLRKKHFLVDFDGVFTSLTGRNDVPLIGRLINEARQGNDIDIATGQSLDFLIETVVPILQKAAGPDKDLLDHFTLNGENGIRFCRFKNGDLLPVKDFGKGLQAEHMRQLEQVYSGHSLSWPNLRVYPGKKGTFTVDSRDRTQNRDQARVEEQLGETFRFFSGIVRGWKGVGIRRTSNAVDVYQEGAEKDLVGNRILSEYARRSENSSTSPRRLFVIIGDSESDLAMAKPFRDHQVPYAFHFVGIPKKGLLRKMKAGFLTRKKFNRGTREVLGRSARKMAAGGRVQK